MDYNNNRYETEEEKKDKMRKEILDELNNNSMKSIDINGDIQSFGQSKKKSAVSFNKENSSNYDYNTSNDSNNITNNNNNNNINNDISTGKMLGIFVVGILVMILIYFFPVISKKIDDFRLNYKKNHEKNETVQEEKVEEEIKYNVSDDIVKSIKYPVLHVDLATKRTYLAKDSLTIKDISVNDLLYNSFLANANLTNNYTGGYSSAYCGTAEQKKYIKAYYVSQSVNDIFGKKVSVDLQSFVVPTFNGKTNYSGTWLYVKSKSYFVYMGDCKPTKTNVLYYDISVPYDVDGSNKTPDLTVYSNVAFAEVNRTDKSYTLYSDANYTTKVSSGKLSSNSYESELNTIVEKQKDSFKKYKYNFTQTNCPFKEYCFSSGEWIK